MAEDDQALRACIAEYLTRVGYEVTAVDSGLKFYHALAEQPYHVAIIDIGLPDMSGLQLSEYLRKNTTTRCIILTANDSVDDRITGYGSGADLYMVKPVDCRELAAAIACKIQRVSADSLVREPSGHWRLNRQNATLISPSCAIIQLTGRELDFLLSLVGAPGETTPRTTILADLGYTNDEFANRALESLVRRLRRKIEHSCGSAPILTRHGVGYCFSAPVSLQ